MTTTILREALDALALGGLEVAEARAAVRGAIEAGAGMVDRAYVALRDATWRMVSARRAPDDLAEWYDLGTHAAALAKRAQRTDVSERLSTLAELLAQTGRFCDRQPIDEVLGRRHVARLLRELVHHGGSAPRTALAAATRLGDANLSRLLSILDAHGLVERSRSGRLAVVGLTAAGRAACAKLAPAEGRVPPEVVPAASTWWRTIGLPVALWSAAGDPVGANDAFRDLAVKAGCPAPSALSHDEWAAWLLSAALEEVPGAMGAGRDILLPGDLWVRYFEQPLEDGGRLAYAVDISSALGALRSVGQQLRSATEQNAELHSRLAAAEAASLRRERQLLSFAKAEAQLRSEMVARTSGLASMMLLARPTGTVTSGLVDAGRHLTALRAVLRHPMPVPGWGGHTPALAELFDMRTLLEQSLELVSTPEGPHILLGFQGPPRGLADVGMLRAAIGQTIMTHVWETKAANYSIDAEFKGSALRILCRVIGREGKVAPGIRADEPLVAAIDHGFGYCRDLAEAAGGSLHAGTGAETGGVSFVEIVLPIGMPNKARGLMQHKWAVP